MNHPKRRTTVLSATYAAMLAIGVAACAPKVSPEPPPEEAIEDAGLPPGPNVLPGMVTAHHWLHAFKEGRREELARLSASPFSQFGFWNGTEKCPTQAANATALDALFSCMRTEEPSKMLYQIGWRWLATLPSPFDAAEAWSIADAEKLKEWSEFQRNPEALKLLEGLDTVQLDVGVRGDGGCLFLLALEEGSESVSAIVASCWIE